MAINACSLPTICLLIYCSGQQPEGVARVNGPANARSSSAISVDLLESEFVHEGRGSRVSREQFMMVLSHIRVLHIRASYYSAVSRVMYVINRADSS